MRLFYTDTADAELEKLGEHIAADSPVRALEFVAKLRSAVDILRIVPRAYPLLESHAEHGIRKMTYGNYVVLYHVSGDAISIARVINAAMDYTSLLATNNKNTPQP